MITEVTVMRDGVATRIVRLTGLFETGKDALAALRAKCPAKDLEGATVEFALLGPIAEDRDKAGEYEIMGDGIDDEPHRAWAVHTTRFVTVRCPDYVVALTLYYKLLLEDVAELAQYRVPHDRDRRDLD